MKTEHLSYYRGAIATLAILTIGLATTTAISVRRAQALALEQEERDSHRAPPPPGKTTKNDDVALLRELLKQRDTDNMKLRNQLSQLQRLTESKDADAAKNTAVAPPTRVASNQPGAWLERIRQEDPERYKQIQQEREQRRQTVQNWYKDQYQQLDDRLQGAATQDEADLVTQLADALQHVEDLGQKWQEIRSLPEDERSAQTAELGSEMRDAYQTLSQLRAQDRQMQLQQLANQIGYRDPGVAGQFVDSINGIIKNTEVNPMRGMGIGGGFGRNQNTGNQGASPQPQPQK